MQYKRLRSLIILILLIIAPSYFAASTAAQGKLMILVSNIKTSEGTIKLALFNSKQSYTNSNAKPYRVASGTITSKGTSIITLNNLPYGEYAIKLFQDKDNVGHIETNWLGIPKEGYGFSDNAIAQHSIPDYDAVKFLFTATNNQQKITLQYYGQ